MKPVISQSSQLIGATFEAALKALSTAPNGQLPREALLQAIEAQVNMDTWARETYASGHTRWRSIFAFASVGLVKGGYVSKERGVWTILDEGRAVLAKPYDPQAFVAEVNRRYLAWKAQQVHTEPFVQSIQGGDVQEAADAADALEAPDERMARTLRSAHEALSAELIETLKSCDPAFFEKLVVQLLLNMGYGGSRQEAGRAVGQSGDGGIDGIISEDRLGLDAIYLQAKRWEAAVGEPPIRDFFGALDIKGVKKGVFLTTSYFTEAAKAAVKNSRSDKKIVLIDGARLAQLMIEYDLGVSVAATYQLKRMDTDYFAED